MYKNWELMNKKKVRRAKDNQFMYKTRDNDFGNNREKNSREQMYKNE